MEINYTELLNLREWDNVARSYTACVGWDVCQCNRCRFARTAIQHIFQTKEEIFNDKELMLILCNCDRHEDVHLEGCEYLKQKQHHLSPSKEGTSNSSSKKDCPKCHKNLLLSEQEIKENKCCYCRSSPS